MTPRRLGISACLRRWIERGRSRSRAEAAKLDRLEITPPRSSFQRPARRRSFKVVAHWSDGTREDVTPLCRFRTNDESIAKIDETRRGHRRQARATRTSSPSTTTASSPVPVLLPVSDQVGERYPERRRRPTKIDELVVAKLRKLGIVPSELCTDAEFLRRVSLDLTGTLPTPSEVDGVPRRHVARQARAGRSTSCWSGRPTPPGGRRGCAT